MKKKLFQNRLFVQLGMLVGLFKLMLVSGCQGAMGDEIIFFSSEHCQYSIQKECHYHLKQEDIFLTAEFTPYPQKMNSAYQLIVKQAKKAKKAPSAIRQMRGELIGLNMPMGENRFSLAYNGESWIANISPSFCTKDKMLWRLKLNLTLDHKKRYYTFIDYTIYSPRQSKVKK